ncbi:hypothetical protein [Actinomadura sp. CNU-125]|uniref:hypothetical protein n=1 Tax=Actinomadura sp. CNU-125 TaxID=1904961 RepID=UPI0011779113|nr:hypothetical protein [Actinomadura sp. CNU-125]
MTLTHLLLLAAAVVAAAGTCLDMARPPRPAGDDTNGTSDCRSYGATTRRPTQATTAPEDTTP